MKHPIKSNVKQLYLHHHHDPDTTFDIHGKQENIYQMKFNSRDYVWWRTFRSPH